MISTGLAQRRVALPDGRTAYPYPWRGGEVAVHDDAMSVIEAITLLRDPDLADAEKEARFLPLFFVDWRGAWEACGYDNREFGELIDSAVWDVCGIDMSGRRACEAPLWDLDEDADRIRASFRQAYGIDWDAERASISFGEFVALVGGCPPDTPLGRAVHYRNPATRPKRTKHNKKEVEAWERLHAAYALGRKRAAGPAADPAEATQRGMLDAFAALKQAAR